MNKEEIKRLVCAIERPLLFSYKNDYSNIKRISNLSDIVEELTIKILLNDPAFPVVKSIRKIQKVFSSFDTSSFGDKKRIVAFSLQEIEKLKAMLEEEDDDSSYFSAKNPDFSGLKEDIRFIKGVGPVLARAFAKKGVSNIEDLLFYFPRRYDDRRSIKPLSELQPGRKETVRGEIVLSGVVKTKNREFYKVVISDGAYNLSIIWFRFNKKYHQHIFKKGTEICVTGEIVYNSYEKELQIIHPAADEIEIIDGEEKEQESLNFNRIVPIYPLTEGLSQRRVRSITRYVTKKYATLFSKLIPEDIKGEYNLVDLGDAICRVHYPDDTTGCVDIYSQSSVHSSPAHRTVIFFEFFSLELGIAKARSEATKRRSFSIKPVPELESRFIKSLPFQLTDAQKRVFEEIGNDMERSFPMNRLLQGDVGCGKTIVAILSILRVVANSYQVALMAPTEILAEQHFRSINRYLSSFGVKVAFVRGKMGKKSKEQLYKIIESGGVDVVVGTHALIQEGVKFKSLGLAIVDEQHRFGVVQRSKLVSKGVHSHMLVMTATPIPRTLAITVYGDLDVSVIDKMPPGRKKVTTLSYRNTDYNRKKVYREMEKELRKGRQVYVVCPVIENSFDQETEEEGKKDIAYAVELAKELQDKYFPAYNVGLLHGKMSSEEKDKVMDRFLKNEINILVSTTVVEVGVDVPNATMMVIENAERFGLSQLHQLRGRIGRGDSESKCILLVSSTKSDVANNRIKVMCSTNDGFRIAEEDLKIRGPGDFLGTKQSGIPKFRLADLVRDMKILGEARNAAFKLIDTDPTLSNYSYLKEYLKTRWTLIESESPFS